MSRAEKSTPGLSGPAFTSGARSLPDDSLQVTGVTVQVLAGQAPVNDLSSQIVLTADTVDVGVVLNPPAGRATCPLGEDHWVAVLPAAHPLARGASVALAQLVAQPFVLATGGCSVHAGSVAGDAGLGLAHGRATVVEGGSRPALGRRLQRLPRRARIGSGSPAGCAPQRDDPHRLGRGRRRQGEHARVVRPEGRREPGPARPGERLERAGLQRGHPHRAPLVPGWGAARSARRSPRMIDRSRRSVSRKRGIVAARLRSSGSAV